MTTTKRQWVVLNPGNHPAPKWLAASLAENGELDSYWTAAQYHQRQRIRYARLASRRLPPNLSRDATVVRRATGYDLAASAALVARRVAARKRLITKRDHQLGRSFAEYLREARPALTGVLLPTGTQCDVDTIVKNLGLSLAHYTPLPDPDFVATLLRREQSTNPKWAEHLGVGQRSHQSPGGTESSTPASADIIIANSSFTAASYSATSQRIETVPLASDYRNNDKLRALSAHPRTDGEALKIAFAGQINQRKGISYLFDAVSRAHHSKVTLHFYGTDATGFLKALHDVYPNVDYTHTNRLNQEALWEALSRAHVFAFPTLVDGFGNALAEAASLGLPAIVTPNCGAADMGLLPNAALSVPPGSSAAIAGAIETYMDEPLRRQMGASARQVTMTGRTWNEYGREAREALWGRDR